MYCYRKTAQRGASILEVSAYLLVLAMLAEGRARAEPAGAPIAVAPGTPEGPVPAAANASARAATSPETPPLPAPPPAKSAETVRSPLPAAALAPAPIQTTVLSTASTDAVVHVAVDYPGAWLEGRSGVDLDRWHRLCAAPCDRRLRVDGVEMRVTAPQMTRSNVFLVEPGPGVARLRVSGGSSRQRQLGLIGLIGGLPVTFAGVTLLGVGTIRDQPGERTAGIVTLAVGAAAVLAALPLLVLGSTSVRGASGRHVAARASLPRFY